MELGQCPPLRLTEPLHCGVLFAEKAPFAAKSQDAKDQLNQQKKMKKNKPETKVPTDKELTIFKQKRRDHIQCVGTKMQDVLKEFREDEVPPDIALTAASIYIASLAELLGLSPTDVAQEVSEQVAYNKQMMEGVKMRLDQEKAEEASRTSDIIAMPGTAVLTADGLPIMTDFPAPPNNNS